VTTPSRILARSVALALVASCSSAKPASSPSTVLQGEGPPAAQAPSSGTAKGVLAPLASEALIILPAQKLRASVPEWSDKIADPKAYLGILDDEISFAVKERGLKAQWAFPADLARSAKRNPGYTADPYNIAVDALTPVERDPDRLITEPLAGQLRAFAGLFNARYALIPVEMRLAPDPSGGRPTLHLVLVDTRAARLTWKADISGDGVKNFTPAIAATVAGRVADLFITAR